MAENKRFKTHVRGGLYANWSFTVIAEDQEAAFAEAMRRIRRGTPATVNAKTADKSDATVHQRVVRLETTARDRDERRATTDRNRGQAERPSENSNMTRLQQLRKWLDEKTGEPPDEFDLKSNEILQSPTASETQKKEVRRLVRVYDRCWALENAAFAAAPATAMGCLLAGLPTNLVLLIVGCQTTGFLLFRLRDRNLEIETRRRLTQAGWTIHGTGITAGLSHLFTM